MDLASLDQSRRERYRDAVRFVLLVAALLVSLGAAPQGGAEMVGTWDLTVSGPQESSSAVLVVKERDGELTARWSGVLGTLDAVDTTFKAGELRLVLEVTSTTDGSTFTKVRLPFRARLEDDRLEGTLRSPSGDDLTVQGSRAG